VLFFVLFFPLRFTFASIRYRFREITLPINGLTDLPCGRCPVIDRCSHVGNIRAPTCEYMATWFDQW